MCKKNLATSGESIDYLRPPGRIVSLTPAASEIICIFGGMDKIVGRDDHSSFPPGLDDIPTVGSSIHRTISVEGVLSLDPDVVVAGRNILPETLEAIEDAGVPVVVIGMSCDVESIIANVWKLSEMMDAKEKAKELVEFVEEYANLVRNRTCNLAIEDKPLVYHECAFRKYKTTPAETPADDCIGLAGGINVAHDEFLDKPVVSGEWVAKKNPDIILSQVPSRASATSDSLKEKRDEILSRPELEKTDAKRKGNVYVSHLFIRRGPRLVGYLLYLGKWFHPELFEDIDPAAVEREMLLKFYGIEMEGAWACPEI